MERVLKHLLRRLESSDCMEAKDSRLARVEAASEIRESARTDPRAFTEREVISLRRAMFDCSSAVRELIARCLFLVGEEECAPDLEVLLETEEDVAVRRAVGLTLRRISELGRALTVPSRRIVVVTDSLALMEELYRLADAEDAVVKLACPGTPDLLVMSGCVRVIDRELLGTEAWEAFRAYLEELNKPICPSEIDDEELLEVLGEIEGDEAPLILIDHCREGFTDPRDATGCVLHIGRSDVDLIVAVVRHVLRHGVPDLDRAIEEVKGSGAEKE